jgi:hypothetical protein
MVNMTNGSLQISTPNSSSPSNVLVNLATTAIPLNGSYANGISNGTYISSPTDSLPITQSISPSNVVVHTSSSFLPSNGALSGGDGAFNSTISPSGTYSVTTTTQPSSGMVRVTSSLLPSKRTVSDGAIDGIRTTSPNGTHSVTVIIQPSTAIAPNVNSSHLQVNGPSKNTSSVSLHVNSSSTEECVNGSCQNSTIDNSTELVKVYKTEFYGEVSITVFTNTKYTVWVQYAGNLSVNCSFIPGDRTPGIFVKTNISSVSFSHRYFRPVRYRARIICVHNETVLVDASRRVSVSLPVVYDGLSCPDRFRTDTTYYCVFNVDQASDLDVEIAIGSDLARTHSFAGKISTCIIKLGFNLVVKFAPIPRRPV